MFARQYAIRGAKTILDAGFLAGAYFLAFVLRFEGSLSRDALLLLLLSLPVALAVKLVFWTALRIPRLTWRHVSIVEAQRVLLALGLATGTLLAWRLAPDFLGSQHVPAGLWGQRVDVSVPLGVLLIDFLLSVLLTLGVRAGVRRSMEWTERKLLSTGQAAKIPTLIIGAGSAGAMVARGIAAQPDAGIRPVGFLDDDASKVGSLIHGISVVGTTDQISEMAQKYGARQALISIANVPGTTLRRIAATCKKCGIPAKIIPGIRDVIEGKVNLARIRDIAIEDLLRRDPITLDTEAISGIVRSRRVLVTGAGGSIGSELCQEVCRYGPATLVLVEQAENSLFHINWMLSEEFPEIDLVPCIADICDDVRMEQIFECYRPEIVFHAAAHKHVPLMEWNPGEAVKNNVIGTRKLTDLAHAFGVSEFVMISTDKAVNPTSVMGVSKRVAEMYVQTLSQRSDTRFVIVRFGNVLGSTGSVVPIFKEQIAKGGPITVTHPEMQRYFMTIPEACQLVLQAASMGKGGEIFILDMGEPVRIVDLAKDLVRLSGLSPDDVEIRFTGIRHGEKLFEEIALDEENADKTQHPRIYIGRLKPHDWEAVDRHVSELAALADCGEPTKVLAKFKEIVPEYQYDYALWLSVYPPSRYNGENGRHGEAGTRRNGAPPTLPSPTVGGGKGGGGSRSRNHDPAPSALAQRLLALKTESR